MTPGRVAVSRETATGGGGRPLVRPVLGPAGAAQGAASTEKPHCLCPSETLSLGRRSGPLGASRRLEVTHLEGSQELPAPRADAACLEGSQAGRKPRRHVLFTHKS